MEKIRAFVAVEIPNNETIDNIIVYQSELQRFMGPLKLVDRSIMHLTLQFLGRHQYRYSPGIIFLFENRD